MLSLLLSLLLGIFYIVSGVGKLLDVYSFGMTVSTFGVPQTLGKYMAIVTPPFEILLGFSLIFFVHNRKFAFISAATIVLFTAGFAYAYLVHGVSSCGCFGVITALSTSPFWSFIRNGIIFAISLFLVFRPLDVRSASFSGWQLIILFLVTATSFSLSAISYRKPLYAQEPFMGKHVKDTPIGAVVQTNPDSLYMIYCFAPDCSHCMNATENVKAYLTSGKVDRIIGLGYGTEARISVFKKRFSPNFDIRPVRGGLFGAIIGQSGIPKVFLIRRDTVVAVMSKEIPSPWAAGISTLRKEN